MEKGNNEEKVHNPSDEPIVLGFLRKEKSSKPAFVLIVFLVVIGICLGLPYIQAYLKDSTSFIGQIYNKYFGEEEPQDKIVVNNDSLHLLDGNTKITYDNNLQITNVSYNNETITYYIKTLNQEINLDETTLYLEIFGSTNNLLRRIKLSGSASQNEAKIEYIFSDFRFNNGISYYGRIRKMLESEYPEANISANGSIKCTKKDHSYTYDFNDFKLITIHHDYFYPLGEDNAAYLSELSYYQELAAKLNEATSSANVEESTAGLNFKAEINIANLNIKDLGDYINYNYYEASKVAKILIYEMESKGFDCQ